MIFLCAENPAYSVCYIAILNIAAPVIRIKNRLIRMAFDKFHIFFINAIAVHPYVDWKYGFADQFVNKDHHLRQQFFRMADFTVRFVSGTKPVRIRIIQIPCVSALLMRQFMFAIHKYFKPGAKRIPLIHLSGFRIYIALLMYCRIEGDFIRFSAMCACVGRKRTAYQKDRLQAYPKLPCRLKPLRHVKNLSFLYGKTVANRRHCG